VNEEKAPFLSIVVLCFKVETYLPECLESIRNQTFRDYEVIMVDDGSPDGCGEICDRYAAMDSRFHAIHKPNGGIVAARKTALNAARGIWCGSVDGDDWIDPEMYEKMCGTVKKYGVEFVQCDEYLCYQNKRYRDHEGFSTRILFGEEYAGFLREMLQKGKRKLEVSLCRVILKTEMLREILDPMDDRCALCEDAACLFVYAARAGSMCSLEEPLYFYRMRENSCTGTLTQREEKWLYWLFNYVVQATRESPWQEILLKWLAVYFANHCAITFYMKGALLKEQERERYLRDAAGSEEFRNMVSAIKINEYPLYFSKSMIECIMFQRFSSRWITGLLADSCEDLKFP